ncbi:MAG: bifunctional riboflavin kinase/FAD synthetase [Clostridia bacterium]|nr:bifunctional riboflavin kinase/FAD synthetase [Clostridia bacterium]
MRVIRGTEKAGERVVALGTFDGVHLGHQALLKTAGAYAKEHGIPLRVYTFDRHPLDVIAPRYAPKILTTLPEKMSKMCRLGVDEVQLVTFDRSMADMAPEAFLSRLRETMDVRAVVAGWNYTFGRKAGGNAALLREDGAKHGYDVLIEEPVVRFDGTAVSSSLIREELQAGNTDEADTLMRAPYVLTGTVTEGKHEGHRLGFPTANIVWPQRKVLPAFGVYTCLIQTTETVYTGVVNIGVQPTLPSGKVTVEAHALNGNPELYGQKVRLTVLERLRGEVKFQSAEELKKQIQQDKARAIRLFEGFREQEMA